MQEWLCLDETKLILFWISIVDRVLRTPVVLIIFNRPHFTERVFAEIARAKPEKLFIIADGPRADRPDEKEKCAAARAIVDRVDWDCDVLKNYSEVNLGCGLRPATGISWVFEHVEEAIILEDDCVPHPAFFRFCDELLERYRDDERVMMIAGSNRWFRQKRTAYSYHFSRLPWNWGWATWRRAWRRFDIEIKPWPHLRETKWLSEILENTEAVGFWRKAFDEAHAGKGKVDFWDYQWTFACWSHSGLCVYPNTNLITNIGFGEDATHTKNRRSVVAYLPTFGTKFPLQHPPAVAHDKGIDEYVIQLQTRSPSVKPLRVHQKLYRKFGAFIPRRLQKAISNLGWL